MKLHVTPDEQDDHADGQRMNDPGDRRRPPDLIFVTVRAIDAGRRHSSEKSWPDVRDALSGSVPWDSSR